MIVSAPASATRNPPPVPLAAPTEAQGSNAAKTIPFKNVLDGLEAYGTSSDENVSGEQKADSQDPTSKKNGTSAGNKGASAGKTMPDATPGPQRHGAPQLGMLQIPFQSNQNLTQAAVALAAPDASSASDTTDAPAAQKTAGDQQNASALEAIAPESTEPAESVEQGHTVPTSTGKARTGASVQTPQGTASSAPGKSSAIEANLIADPAPAVNAVSASKAVPAVTPAVTSSAAKPQAMTKPEIATEAGSGTPKLQTPGELRPASPSRSVSLASTVPSQPKSTPVASPEAIAVPSPHGVGANPPAANKWQQLAAETPQTPRTSAAGSVSDKSPKVSGEPEASSTTAPVPATKGLVSKTAVAQVLPQSRQSIPATTLSQPAVTPPIPAAPAITTRATTPVAPPPSTSPNPKDTSARNVVSPDSLRSDSVPADDAPTNAGRPQRAANNIDSTALPPAVTHIETASAPAAERPAPETPESNVGAQSEAIEGAATAKSQTPLAPQAENFAFAVRMIAPDDAVLAEAQPTVSAAQPQISGTKPAVTQQAPAQAPQQPGQSETSSNSKIETQSPAPDTDKTGPRDSKAADLPQSGQTQETVARSEVSVTPVPSEINSALPSSGLAEAAHDSPSLAAQETHLMTPELPRTSASTDILLHLTGDGQSSAAIRVADRAGTVNVSVHAADPVLRESLRSNIEQLSSQLTGQGWKADVMKPAAVAAQSDSQPDSHSGGQRSSQQQQSFGGDRQQRDRRAQAGYWQQELDQQISGGDAQTGGKG